MNEWTLFLFLRGETEESQRPIANADAKKSETREKQRKCNTHTNSFALCSGRMQLISKCFCTVGSGNT
jgi:hypothetical protein